MRGRLLAVVALALVIAPAVLWWRTPPAFTMVANPDRNVLLITIDTLRADALGVYGGRASTPYLDALAASGAAFTFAHAHAVVTLPSHTSIMTGLYPYTHGVRDNNGYRVPADRPTLATRLKAQGFATGAFVGAFPLDQRFGLGRGFDVYDDRLPEAGPAEDFALPERRADVVVAAARSWIGAQTGRWFSWVHVFDPHAPYQPPEAFSTQYPDDPYAGEVAWTDSALGPLLDHLRSSPRPTLVIVTADHGESLGEHGELTHGIFAYEATLRVPLIIAEIPGVSATQEPPRRAVTVDHQVRHVDIAPTILDALALPADDNMAGTSIRALINDNAVTPRPMYFEAMTPNLSRGWAPLRGVLVDRDKYIDLPIAERYDLRNDGQELANLASSDPTRTLVMFNTLKTFDVAPPGRPGEESGAVLERLRALGYVGGSPAPARAQYGDADDPKRLIDIDKLLHTAGDLFSRGQRLEAARTFRSVIDRRPDTADAYRYLAFVLWESGQPAEAITTLETALARGLTQRDIRLKLGLYLAESGQPSRAIPLLEALPPDDTDSFNALGIAYAQHGRSADAMRAFTEALARDATSALAYQNIATLHLRAGDYAAAESALRRALTIDDTLVGAYNGLGVVLARRGRPADALDAWRRALTLNPNDLDALFNVTMELVAAGRRAEARPWGERYVALAPATLYASDIARVRAALDGRQ